MYQLNLDANPYTVTTLTSGFNCNGGLALNKTGNALYVLDQSDMKIQKMAVPATTAVAFGSTTTVAGNGGGYWYSNINNSATALTTSLLSPHQLALDSHENIYVTDGTYVGNLSTSPMQILHDADPTNITGIYIDELDAVFITLSGTVTTALVKRIFTQSPISLSSGISATVNSIAVPYYSTLSIDGGGTLIASGDHASTFYGKLTVDGNGTTAIINNANAFGSGGSDNSFVLSGSAVLKAGATTAASTDPTGTTISTPLNYSGNVALDTADTVNATHALRLSGLITCLNPSTSLLTVKGGGTIELTKEDTGIDSATVKKIAIVDGSTIKLSSASNNVNYNVSIEVGSSGKLVIGKSMTIQGFKA